MQEVPKGVLIRKFWDTGVTFPWDGGMADTVETRS